MSDLPSFLVRQQAHAKPVAGEDLEVMGKHAALQYLNGFVPTLTEAVTSVVKEAALSPEQVRRVVEFTNVNAYIQEFNKEGAADRYISFHGGPADVGEVLRDLNDGGGGTVFDRGTLDYHTPPPAKTAELRVSNEQALAKLASAPEEDENEKFARSVFGPSMGDIASDMAGTIKSHNASYAPHMDHMPFGGMDDSEARFKVQALRAMTGRSPVVVKMGSEVSFDPVEDAFKLAFAAEDLPLVPSNPLAPAERLYVKLSGDLEHMTAEVSSAELRYHDSLTELCGAVKTAALEGATLGQVVRGWSELAPPEGIVKAAFQVVGPFLVERGVYQDLDALGESLTKTAAHGTVNLQHPVILAFAEFSDSLQKLSSLEAERLDLERGVAETQEFLKRANTLVDQAVHATEPNGLVGHVTNFAARAGKATAPVVRRGAEMLLGKGDGAHAIGEAARLGVTYAPHAAAVVAGKEIFDRVSASPAVQYAASHVPGTQANLQRQYNLMGGQ